MSRKLRNDPPWVNDRVFLPELFILQLFKRSGTSSGAVTCAHLGAADVSRAGSSSLPPAFHRNFIINLIPWMFVLLGGSQIYELL